MICTCKLEEKKIVCSCWDAREMRLECMVWLGTKWILKRWPYFLSIFLQLFQHDLVQCIEVDWLFQTKTYVLWVPWIVQLLKQYFTNLEDCFWNGLALLSLAYNPFLWHTYQCIGYKKASTATCPPWLSDGKKLFSSFSDLENHGASHALINAILVEHIQLLQTCQLFCYISDVQNTDNVLIPNSTHSIIAKADFSTLNEWNTDPKCFDFWIVLWQFLVEIRLNWGTHSINNNNLTLVFQQQFILLCFTRARCYVLSLKKE